MASTVASRYAVLSVDVDDDYSNRKKKNPARQQLEPKPTIPSSSKSDSAAKTKKKTKTTENTQSNGKTKSKSNNAKKKKEPTAQQWEEWKEKDALYVDGNYEEDLTQAILLSKLDFEEKKQLYDSIKKATEDEKKLNRKGNKKGFKVMSLDEFNNLGSSNSREDSPSLTSSVDMEKMKEDPEFIEKIKEDVKKEISKEQRGVKVKRVREPFNQEALTLAQYEDALEKRDKDVLDLREEVITLKAELHNVKTRNKQLCQIISNGEMKNKAEILMEVERLQGVKDELSTEVANLHVQLEQERSKVRALAGEHKNKDKKKRTASSSENVQ